MSTNKMFIWVEKYRPANLEDVILPKETKRILRGFISQGNIPHLLFSGSPGIGKTTVAYALANELHADLLFINGSKDNGIDVLRTQIEQFSSAVSMTGAKKIVFIDEAENLNPLSTQPALRAFIEQFSDNVSFIFTCNYRNKLLEPLRSRLTEVEFRVGAEESVELMKDIFRRACNILDAESVRFSKATVANLVKQTFPDMRRLLNTLQINSIGGVLAESAAVDVGAIDALIDALKGKRFHDMRRWVVENSGYDFDRLCDDLYAKMETDAKPESLPQALLILADYQYKAAFVANRVINTAAMLTELMGSVEWEK